MKYLNKKLLLTIFTPFILLSCTTHQKVTSTAYIEIEKEGYPIHLSSISAQDSSFQELSHEYIEDIIFNNAFKRRMTITNDTNAPYKMALFIKETKFEKNLNTYFSIWSSLEILDNNEQVVLRILLVNNSQQSIQSSAYLYKLLSELLKELQKNWVQKKWSDPFIS